MKTLDKLRIGIVVADIDEYASLEGSIIKGEFENYSFLGRKGHKFKLSGSKAEAEVITLLCGIGKVNATAAAAHFTDIGCNIILNYGLSGGISGISKGELCLCSSFLEHDFNLTMLGYKPCEKPSQRYIYDGDKQLIKLFLTEYPFVKTGIAVTGDSFICDENIRNILKSEFNAMSCDMETAAIAYVCDFAGIPFLALRKISDDAGNDASESYRSVNCLSEAVLSDCILDFINILINSDLEAN